MVAFARQFDRDQTWTLDAQGNFAEFDDDGTSQTRTTNAANEITSIDDGDVWIDPTYDAAGNMLTGPKTGDETTRLYYRYDAWNRQVRVQTAGFPIYTTLGTYEYDGLNRRIQKTAGASNVHYYYNQQWQMLEERFVTWMGVTLSSNQHVFSPDYIDSPIVWLHDGNGDGDYSDAGDLHRYYLSDANHNTTAVVDSVTGDVEARYVYTAYGECTVYTSNWTEDGPSQADGFLYCGYWLDAGTQNYQARKRYYTVALATWCSRDPIGYWAGDANLYRYVGNCPTTATDPLGLAGGMEGVAQQARYQYALQDWRQCKLNYYHDVMNEMVAVGNIINGNGVGGLAARDPAYANFKPGGEGCNVSFCPGGGGVATNAAGRQFGWPTHWSRLLDAINYSLTNYNDGRYWDYVQGSSMNMPFIPGITMDAQPFDSGDLYTTIMLLIHEPLHDFGQFGVGHGGWGSYGLGDVVGPTNSPPEGSYYDQFYDFLQNARCGGTSLWDAIKKKVGDCKCGEKPKWGDYVK